MAKTQQQKEQRRQKLVFSGLEKGKHTYYIARLVTKDGETRGGNLVRCNPGSEHDTAMMAPKYIVQHTKSGAAVLMDGMPAPPPLSAEEQHAVEAQRLLDAAAAAGPAGPVRPLTRERAGGLPPAEG